MVLLIELGIPFDWLSVYFLALDLVFADLHSVFSDKFSVVKSILHDSGGLLDGQ